MPQTDLFTDMSDDHTTSLNIQTFHLDKVCVDYYRDLLSVSEAAKLVDKLTSELNWQQPNIHIAGKQIPIPRKQVWFGDKPYDYTYSGMTFRAESWTPELLTIKQSIEKMTGETFNSGLCNLYRNGKDSVSWHADDEPELGEAPIIASFSLGEVRQFQLRKKENKERKFKINLEHNSLLLMGPGLQAEWEHQIPKSTRELGPRINITFRTIID